MDLGSGGGSYPQSHTPILHFFLSHFYPWQLYVGPPPLYENPGSALVILTPIGSDDDLDSIFGQFMI